VDLGQVAAFYRKPPVFLGFNILFLLTGVDFVAEF
jgi:hypothetical protein